MRKNTGSEFNRMISALLATAPEKERYEYGEDDNE